MQNGTGAMEGAGKYREFLPDLSQERFTRATSQNPKEYGQYFAENRAPPWLHDLVFKTWDQLIKDPFHGVTADGNVIPNLFSVEDEGIPISDIVSAALEMLSKVSAEQKKQVHYNLDSRERRKWMNPEPYINHLGLRLEELDSGLRLIILNIIKASLSPEGYNKAISAMRINGFLGSKVKLPNIMNEHSYNFCLFGQPSTEKPWAWSLFGHHLCLNAFFYGKYMVISPWFTGAEPNIIDEGNNAGTRILHVEEKLGLRLMQSLIPEMQRKAQLYEGLKPPDLPNERWNPDDQRHLCGAFRDNRIVPYEGVCLTDLSQQQKNLAADILEQFLLYYPQSARSKKLARCREFFEKDTYFCWIGGFEEDSPFYFRIQSPVIIAEFDHHSGVFLNNTEPKKFHVHTICRFPNGGDYGAALLPADLKRCL